MGRVLGRRPPGVSLAPPAPPASWGCAAGGVIGAGAQAEVEELAERTGALLTTTLPARGMFDHNPFSIGTPTPHATAVYASCSASPPPHATLAPGGLLGLTWAGLAPADRASFAGAFPHSITASASASSFAGTSRPSVFAVLRLSTSSNLTDCCTGKSAGFSPFKIRPA
jgi:hypothetical protein